MNRETLNLSLINIIKYFLSFMIIALTVVMLIKSNFGAGPWDCVTYSLSKLTILTLGQSSFTISFTIMAIVIIYNRNIKFLLMLVPIFFVGLFIDFWDLHVFKELYLNKIIMFIFFVTGLLLLPFGLALLIDTGLPAGVFDELMIIQMKLFKTNKLALIRFLNETFGVILALVLGYFAGIGFGTISLGTILLAISIGPLIKFYLLQLRKEHQIELQ